MSFSAKLEAQVRVAQRALERQLPSRLDALDGVDLETLRREAHKLHGGITGHPAFTRLAASLEEAAAKGAENDARGLLVMLRQEATRIVAREDAEDEDTGAPRPRATLRSERHVLIADDDSAVLRMNTLVLERMGRYRVSACDSGVEALKRVRGAPFDLVIADAMMPGMSGIDLCRTLCGAGVPVVILSAASRAELDAKNLRCRWWRKPIAPGDLIASIEAVFSEK